MRPRGLIVAAMTILTLASTSQCQELSSHPFSRRYVATQLTLECADSALTWRTADRYNYRQSHDQNPVAQLAIRQGPSSAALYFGAELALKIGSTYWLHRTGHHRAERILEALYLTDSTYGVVSNVRRRK